MEAAVKNRMTRRTFLGASGSVGVASLLAPWGVRSGGSAAATQEISLQVSYWGGSSRDSVTRAATALFANQNHGVKVSEQYTGSSSDYDSRLNTEMAGHNAPDLIQMSGQHIREYAAKGSLLNLNRYVGHGLDLKDWASSITDNGKFSGKLYGLMPGIDAYCVIVNRTKLSELKVDYPSEKWNWNEFATLAKDAHRAGGSNFYGSNDFGGSYSPLQCFLRQRGKDLFINNKVGFNKTDLLDWWNFWGTLRKEGAILPPALAAAANTGNIDTSALVKGQSVFEFQTASLFTNFVALTKDQLSLAMNPFGNNGKPGQTPRAPMFWVIYADSPHASETVKLMNFLLNNKQAGKVLGATRGVPPNSTIRKMVEGATDEADKESIQFYNTVSKYGKFLEPLPVGWTDFLQLYTNTYQSVAFGRTSMKDAANQFMAQAPKLITSGQ